MNDPERLKQLHAAIREAIDFSEYDGDCLPDFSGEPFAGIDYVTFCNLLGKFIRLWGGSVISEVIEHLGDHIEADEIAAMVEFTPSEDARAEQRQAELNRARASFAIATRRALGSILTREIEAVAHSYFSERDEVMEARHGD